MLSQEITFQHFGDTHWCFCMGQKYGLVASLSPLGKSLEMTKSISLQSFSKLTNKCHTPSYVLRGDHFPLRSWVVGYMLKVQKQFLTLTFQNHTRSEQKDTLKAKFRFVVGCERWKKWLGGQDATHLLHNASIDSSMNEAF